MDWTAQIVEDAELSDLSPEAIAVARRGFAEHNASRIPTETIESWTDEEFLRHDRPRHEARHHARLHPPSR